MASVVLVAGMNVAAAVTARSVTRGEVISFVLGGLALVIGVAALVMLRRELSRERDKQSDTGADAP